MRCLCVKLISSSIELYFCTGVEKHYSKKVKKKVTHIVTTTTELMRSSITAKSITIVDSICSGNKDV